MRCGLLLICVFLLSGCGTIIDLNDRGPQVMGGIQYDWRQISDPISRDRVMIPLFMLDAPLSLGLDIVFLPIAIANRLAEPEAERRPDRKLIPPSDRP